MWRTLCWFILLAVLPRHALAAASAQSGSIRGVLRDSDFGAPLAAAQVMIVETGQRTSTTDQGNFVFSQVAPGRYTLVFTKDGYTRQVRADVVVSPGQLTDLDVALVGEYTEMEEFVVQDMLQIGAGSEAALLKLRFQSPALMDSIGSDLISRAGASDAAAALRYVAGASVADNKSAVIRGLPDRYISSQMNGVVLPTADSDKRAVQLDQFPAPVIESIQVSKTFTPDQQGDASGGAVNVRLKSIPSEGIFQVKGQLGFNDQAGGIDNFLTYPGGGVNQWGFDDGGRNMQLDHLGHNWSGAAGTSTTGAPQDYKWSILAGGKHEIDDGVKIGGLASFYYERYSSFYNDGQDNSYWVKHPGDPMTPQLRQANGPDDFKTALYDTTQGKQGVRWGALGTLGLETESSTIGLTYLYTHNAEDTATVATDTRGKAYYFPGYNPNDPMGEGNKPENQFVAPYVRLETLEYTERTTGTLQLNGQHKLPIGAFEIGDLFKVKSPELSWLAAYSTAENSTPDKRVFGAIWLARSYNPGIPGLQDPYITGALWEAYKPADNIHLGNFQRIWRDINEDSVQLAVDLKFPFEQWSGAEGYTKFGYFDNDVHRSYNQDSFSNFDDPHQVFRGGWDDPWSADFPNENHAITASPFDVDYKGQMRISAWYGMADLPLTTNFNLIGGARVESTTISMINAPDQFAYWFMPGYDEPVNLLPGEADVHFEQQNVLPSIGAVYKPVDPVTLRASYAETVARQTFKELSPIVQADYAGGPAFFGNPELQMSSLKNYDVRVDYAPHESDLLSASWFYKSVANPIENVQRTIDGFPYTTVKNYPKGELHGYELEARQDLSLFSSALDGLAVGANATFISSQVTLPSADAALLSQSGVQAPMATRDMTNAPDHLYNLYFTYDLHSTGTQFSAFYTVQGDTLIAGATTTLGASLPNVYQKQFDSLNFTLSQKLWTNFVLQFQAKNLTNPAIETVYRSPYIGADVLKTTYTKGIDLSLSLTATFGF
jgi:TonB-dependent receptor